MTGICCDAVWAGNALPADERSGSGHSAESQRSTFAAGYATVAQTPAAENVNEEQRKARPIEREEPAPIGFQITEFIVEGSELLPEGRINEILGKYKGQGKTLADIERARVELEKAYQTLGYPTVLVIVPEQTIEQGSVKMQVIEGRLLEINVTGNRYFSRYNILGKLPSLKIGALIKEQDLVKELDAVNANPDLKVAPVLKPGSEQGTVDLELKAKERLPLHARMIGDNKGPLTTPATRLTVEGQYTNLWDRDHILTLQTTQTPTDWGAVAAYGFSYVAPLKWPDHLLAAYASRVKSKSVLAGATLSIGTGDVGIAGNATVAGFRYLFPIFKGGKASHQLSVGMDFKRLEETTATFPFQLGTAVVLSPIQYTPASLGYTGTYPDDWGITTLTAAFKGYVAGLIPGGAKKDFAGDPNDPFNSPGNRTGSTGTFGVVQAGVSRIQPLLHDFLLTTRVDGQWANEPLIPAEQYFMGGMDTVRGYVQFEAVGDNGLLWRTELLAPELPPIPIDRFWQRRRSSAVKATVRFAAFYDYARLWVRRASSGQQDIFRLEGAGAGLRLKIEPINLTLQLDQGVALQKTGVTQRGDTFVHFLTSIGF